MSTTSAGPLPTSSQLLPCQSDPFRPSLWLRNSHVQTLTGAYLFGRWTKPASLLMNTSTIGEVLLDDGDRLAFHDDCPSGWQPGDRVALLLHGLSGSYQSPYMPRISRHLNQQSVRTFRLDWRGSGAGMSLARYPYHSGRSEDLRNTITLLQNLCPNSPISVIGFSMGGNIVLKLLGETGASANGATGIARAVAICPPVNLSVTVESLRIGLARCYDWYFAKSCIRDVRRRQQLRPDTVVPEGWFNHLPRTMREFDESFTAPVCGFASADDYYSRSSAIQFLPAIAVPTLIIAAQDDPVVPFGPLAEAALSPCTELRTPKHGGHMGFVTTAGSVWLDRQIIDWTLKGS